MLKVENKIWQSMSSFEVVYYDENGVKFHVEYVAEEQDS